MATTFDGNKSPFKFLDPYTRADENIFFGRDKEVENLYQYVNRNRLVLVYGQSGVGKSSLVRCGLENRFEVTDWAPFFIRRGQDINVSLLQTLAQSRALGGTPLNADQLLPAIESISARYLRPVYLVFDQFEELLIEGSEEEQERFLQTLEQLLSSASAQSCHLLFILREEYFGWLDPFERRIPGFTDCRMRVEPMREKYIHEVIQGTLGHFQVSLENPEEDTQLIFRSLKDKGQVSLPYLQVYLDMLWRKDFLRTHPQGWSGERFPPLQFSTREIKDFGQIRDVLERFLSEQRDRIQQELQQKYPELNSNTVRNVLGAFATDEGTKRQLAYTRTGETLTLSEHGTTLLAAVPPAALSDCLTALEQSRLLRDNGESLELLHDVLAGLINQQRSAEDQRLKEVRRAILSAYYSFEETKEYPSAKQFSRFDELRSRLILDKPVTDFLELTRKHLKKQELFRGLFIAGLIIITLLALGASAIALKQRQKAIESSERVARLLLDDVDKLILKLDYYNAWKKLCEIQTLNVLERQVAKSMLEPAFWYAESRQFSRATDLLKRAAKLGKRRNISKLLAQLPSLDSAQQLQQLRKCIISFDDSRSFRRFNERYYPNMIKVIGGEYEMGDVMNDKESKNEKPHRVTVSNFELAATETTIWQWSIYCADRRLNMNNFSSNWGGEGWYPLTNVDWYQAVDYSKWLNARFKYDSAIIGDKKKGYQLNLAANGYRLPTEAEWEYAAREGGKKIRFGNGKNLANPNEINFDGSAFWGKRYSREGESRGKTVPVGSLNCPNALGFHDMSGNVWEWCWDLYRVEHNAVDLLYSPQGFNGKKLVIRGGSWRNEPSDMRTAKRKYFTPDRYAYGVGFRLARTAL